MKVLQDQNRSSGEKEEEEYWDAIHYNDDKEKANE